MARGNLNGRSSWISGRRLNWGSSWIFGRRLNRSMGRISSGRLNGRTSWIFGRQTNRRSSGRQSRIMGRSKRRLGLFGRFLGGGGLVGLWVRLASLESSFAIGGGSNSDRSSNLVPHQSNIRRGDWVFRKVLVQKIVVLFFVFVLIVVVQMWFDSVLGDDKSRVSDGYRHGSIHVGRRNIHSSSIRRKRHACHG